MSERTKVIAFYAYKGGTGRSFALAHVAWALAREGRRVVVIDLDLSAPSLYALFGKDPAPGFVEYLQEGTAGKEVDVRELVQEVPLDAKASGALYLLQAGRMDRAYLETLQALDWHALVQTQFPGTRPLRDLFDLTSPFDELFGDLAKYLQPDAILLDAPTGLNDTSNLCLRTLADLVIALFAPTRVHLEAMSRVVALLTAEQYARQRKNESPRPDVYCVASTILLSRLGGAHVRRIGDAFAHLDRVRYGVLQRLHPAVDPLELAHQEPAVVSYDERLADTERLPTEVEPREGHFAAFQELLSYVRGALPTALPDARLTPPDKAKLLDDLEPRYGLFAEQEPPELLDSYFLRTHHVKEVNTSRVVLILGGKGSGKTALFSYLTGKGEAVAVHGPRIGFEPDLLCRLQDAHPGMDILWRLYMLSRLPAGLSLQGSVMQEPVIQESVSLLQRLPQNLSLLADFVQRLSAPDTALQVHQTWKAIDEAVDRQGKRLVLCLDGLDAAFKAEVGRRERALVSLFTAWQATFATLHRTELKVFLRADLWERLSFPEKSHFRGREMRLAWNPGDLWRLVLKRAIAAPEFQDWCKKSVAPMILTEGSVESAGEQDLYPYLDRLFEYHIWAGKNSLSRNWIRRRLADAKEAIYPRDLICLLQEAIRTERVRLGEPLRTSENSVISRESLSGALPPTSRQRVDALREEYPELGNVLELLRGLPATGELRVLTSDIAAKAPGGMTADKAIDLLSEAGVLRIEEGNYVVPDLYRHGLEMRRMGPK